MVTYQASEEVVLAYVDGDNWIGIEMDSAATGYWCRHTAGGTTVLAESAAVLTGAFHTVTCKWRTTGSPHLSIQIDTDTPVTSTSALGTFVGTISTLTITRDYGYAGFYMDNLKVYNTWQ
jgi:hypothetical protein